jgi:hypothetical protein
LPGSRGVFDGTSDRSENRNQVDARLLAATSAINTLAGRSRVGGVPLPFYLHDIVIGADDVEIARDWIREGSYVLHCGNAYFMSSSGEVESS